MSEIYENLVELVKFRMAKELEDDSIDKALQLSLSAFNMVPCVTYFTFDDEENIEQISDLLVTYACYVILTKEASSLLIDASSSIAVSNANIGLARELWNNWDSQVNNLKQSDSFYEDFVRE